MAQMLKLVRGFDGLADQDTLDLLAYSDGISPAYEGWTPRTPVGGEEEVIETITLRVKGTSHNNLASVVQDVAQFSEYAKWYQDSPVEKYGVWLRAKLDGESSARQAWVKQLDHGMAASIYSRALNEKYHVNSYVLQARRMPYWEGTAVDTLVNNKSVGIVGGTYHYGAVAGDVHARISYMSVDCGTAMHARRFWAGFRTDRFGGLTDFVPTIGLAKNASIEGGGTSSPVRVGHNYTYDGTMMQFLFAGTPETIYCPAPATYGKYLVLLRAAASEISPYVKARIWTTDQGAAAGNKRYYPWVPIKWDDTSTTSGMKYFEMGVIQAPGGGRTIDGASVLLSVNYGNYMGVDVSRMSGSAAWVGLDSLVFIPLGEGYVKGNLSETLAPGTLTYPSGDIAPPENFSTFEVVEYPDKEIFAREAISSITLKAHEASVDGGVPPGTGLFVLAVDNLTGVSTTAANVTIKTVKRWKELRGAE